jgi:8-oxo-dGTP pyrophosphatase MutT (NUDIX family)
MKVIARTAHLADITTSCGTVIVNSNKEILLCHATGTSFWDIPKGRRELMESPLDAAKRELMEETGLKFENTAFEEIGVFRFQKEKRLHLYLVRAPNNLTDLEHLSCTSYFIHQTTGKAMPEMDAFRWASREDIKRLCILPLSVCLLSLTW